MSARGESAMKAVDLQIDVLHFVNTPWGAKYCDALLNYAQTNTPGLNVSGVSGVDPGDDVRVEIQVTGPGLVSATNRHVGYQPQVSGGYLFKRVLTLAETFAVSSEIAEVINFGAATIPDYPLQVNDLPAESGFVVFDDVQVWTDSRGKPLVVKAFAWDQAILNAKIDGYEVEHAIVPKPNDELGIFLTLYTEPRDERDHMHQEWLDDMAPLFEQAGKQKPPLLPMLAGMWEFGRSSNDEAMRILATFFRFIQEPWVDSRAIVPTRQARKRAAKVGLPPQVRVVELRRGYHDSHRNPDAQPGNYSHRWFVQPHWRNQWYPSEQRHAPKFIHGYVKGPDDKPFIAKDVIYRVDR